MNKLSTEFKKPMLVKVFRTEPLFFIQDKENYTIGYFSSQCKKRLEREYENPSKKLWGQTLKVTKYSLEIAGVQDGEYNPVSYLGREVKFIIEDFSLSKTLKRGKDVNKFVINIGKDEHMQLGIAHFVHQKRVEAGESISIDDFLKNECNLSIGTQYDSFKSVFYGPNPLPEIAMERLECRDDKHKMGQLVTCIIDDSYDKKNLNKGTKRRNIKKEVKQEAIKEDEIILKEEEEVPLDKENVAPTPKKAKRSKRTRKSPLVKETVSEIEEEDATPKKIKKENDFISTIEKILEYSKKPKSAPDMDFSATVEVKEMPKPEKINSCKKQKKMSRFKEYLEWYDLKTQSGKDSVYSRLSTPLSTPAKISLRISQRMASARKCR